MLAIFMHDCKCQLSKERTVLSVPLTETVMKEHAHLLDRSGQFAQQNDEIPLHMVSLATTSLPRLQSNDSQEFSFLMQKFNQ